MRLSYQVSQARSRILSLLTVMPVLCLLKVQRTELESSGANLWQVVGDVAFVKSSRAGGTLAFPYRLHFFSLRCLTKS